MTREQIKTVSTGALWARLDYLDDHDVWFALNSEREMIRREITRRESAACGEMTAAEPDDCPSTHFGPDQ